MAKYILANGFKLDTDYIHPEEFKNYISGMRNLKEKAVLINTANYNDNINIVEEKLKQPIF